MKSQKKNYKYKNKRGGAMCRPSGYTFSPAHELGPGQAGRIPFYPFCSQSGGKKTKRASSKKRRSRKRTKKIDEKKLNLIIDKLCASIKRKCTPKYRKLLKKIVVNNL
jgi:hypothetical protein